MCLMREKTVPKVWARQSDIAKEADVSLATVDRVLNERPGVSIHTARRIWDAIDRLQGQENAPANKQHVPLIFDVILPAGTNSFLNMLADQAVKHGETLKDQNITIRCHRVEGFASQKLADRLREVGQDSNGIAVMAIENPVVREAVNMLSDKNIPVVALVSNLSAQKMLGYVGLNNRAAGRTAAYLANLFAQNKKGGIALFEGSIDLAYSDHQEREFGFANALREYAPDLKIIGKWATQDNHEEAFVETQKMLSENPDLVGIYSIGGGIRGIARALQESGKEKDIIFIGHDLTSYTREYLLNGTLNAIINQNPETEAKEAIKLLADFHRKGGISNSQIHIPTEVFFRENLP